MKNLFFIIIATVALISCDKSTIQQTTDNIKRADSLFTKANDGIKTLDSISKTITDSDGITKKVIIPEIEKQKKSIDSTIKSGGWRIDSINKQIEKITKNVVVGTEVVKTLDSANNALKNGESTIKVLTRTADKILKQTKKQNPNPDNSAAENRATPQEQNNPVIVPAVVEKDPIVKTARLEIQVDDLNAAKALLKQKIRENNADLVTENFSQNEGIQKEYITAKVPLQNFDQLLSNLSGQLGDVKSKSTESEGKDYIASQMCDIEITLLQNENIADTALTKDDKEDTDSFSGAFMKGFKVLGDAMLFLLPFWPLFLIGALVWYFISRNKKKKAEEEFERQQILNQQNAAAYPTQNQTSTEPVQEDKPAETPDTDYSKYLPKN
ncbi:DUF4349 domain-containing protein [Kaistella sp. BT6-1-3]|uniref:DUF4349 domain-containing protein n=1 Tax=Kaistella yananensis TaxID=2989820 RepID=A0ABT3JMT3_9FLAO|nr:DUF4349 domain-containing protein [Kaistella yananensis]MCW4452079.1 DUF4349 domain-containing protein [Kaistella yananensis]